MEEAVTFTCNRNKLYGILHVVEQDQSRGVTICIVSGGPQTRVGGHRLYSQLARYLCANGVNVLRFDYEGMGDSEGELVRFEGAGPSIIAALDFIKQRFPKKMKIIIWSVCDGCTISLMNADSLHDRIDGLIMCNPFILDNERKLANAHLKYYYGRRILKKSFWIDLFLFRIDLIKEMKVVFNHIYQIFSQERHLPDNAYPDKQPMLQEIILRNLFGTSYPVWFIFSSDDMVGMGFRALLNKQKNHRTNIKQKLIKGADHTFTKSHMKKELFSITLEAVHSINDSKG